MQFFNSASAQSVWRGYYYFKDNKVLYYEQIDKNIYYGEVLGSENNEYEVTIDISKPKRSTCNCAHAEGTRRICKHKCALYFAVFPEKADEFMRMVEERQEENEKQREKLYVAVKKYVYSLNKQQLRDELLWLVYNSGEWVFEKFVRDNIER
ncbi:MAG: SWIM zinc finger family protein [Oscillospiraceae bacterium]|nr:SWIM zinc finger family protein [Oscillospiraceae bacterium]